MPRIITDGVLPETLDMSLDFVRGVQKIAFTIPNGIHFPFKAGKNKIPEISGGNVLGKRDRIGRGGGETVFKAT
ncbi:MAG: hypothetical protein LBU64_14810 [Planctomycetota bacterium]|nr:hypothetical protein [Planctomycetota bacterium]